MPIALRYGRGTLLLELPETVAPVVIRKPPMPLLSDPAEAVREAFCQPENAAPLHELAAGAKSVAIAICDLTRPVPNHLFLRPMIETLFAAGVRAEAITILVATGLHRPNIGAELEELVGDRWVLDKVRVVNHLARDDESHVLLGRTQHRGTVVRIDRRFVEADLRIATGLVEPHFMAGWSGGRKVVAPGLAHAETITTFHNARFMSDPLATNCNLHGNPLHEEQLEIIALLGGAFALNTVIDESRQLSFVNFGEITASHSAAVEFVRGYCQLPVPRRYETVVTTAAGYPLDANYYQTIKGMVGALGALKPGGNLVIASACSEGLGSPEFRQAQQRLVAQGPEAFLQGILQKAHADIDEWQTQMQLKPMAAGNVHLVTDGLAEADRVLTGVTVWDSLDRCLQQCLSETDDPEVAVIPEGPYVVPVADAATAAT